MPYKKFKYKVFIEKCNVMSIQIYYKIGGKISENRKIIVGVTVRLLRLLNNIESYGGENIHMYN